MALNIRIKYKHYYISPESLMFNRSQEVKENSSAAKGKKEEKNNMYMQMYAHAGARVHMHARSIGVLSTVALAGGYRQVAGWPVVLKS